MNPLLIIWNSLDETEFSDTKEAFFKKHLINHLTVSGFDFSNRKLTLFDHSSQLLTKDGASLVETVDFDRFSGIVILAELAWENKLYSSLFGFRVVELLRNKDITLPVFICSFLRKDDIYKLGRWSQILKAPCHYYVSLRDLTVDLINEDRVHHLTQDLLEEIKYEFIDQQGILSRAIHRLKDNFKFRKDGAFRDALTSVRKIIPEKHHGELDGIFEAAVKDKEITWNKFKSDIAKLLPVEDENLQDTDSNAPIIEWCVLYCDDNPRRLTEVESKLLVHGIICHTAKNKQEALEKLDRDFEYGLTKCIQGREILFPRNSITVFVCDWRFENELEEWQFHQGADIIKTLFFEKPNFLSFFALTSKKGSLLRTLQKDALIKVYAFSKEDVLDDKSDNGFNIFADTLKEVGWSTWDSMTSSPGTAKWVSDKKGQKIAIALKKFYRLHRLCSRYQEFEDRINKRAIALRMDINEVVSANQGSGEELYEKEFKTSHTIKSLPDQNTSQEIFEEKMAPFHNILVLRRVALAFAYDNRGLMVEDLATILIKKSWEEDNVGRSSISTLISNDLCLKLPIKSVVPHGMLPEEKVWIRQHLKIEFSWSKNKARSILRRLVVVLAKRLGDKEFQRKLESWYSDLVSIEDAEADLTLLLKKASSLEEWEKYKETLKRNLGGNYALIFQQLGITERLHSLLKTLP